MHHQEAFDVDQLRDKMVQDIRSVKKVKPEQGLINIFEQSSPGFFAPLPFQPTQPTFGGGWIQPPSFPKGFSSTPGQLSHAIFTNYRADPSSFQSAVDALRIRQFSDAKEV